MPKFFSTKFRFLGFEWTWSDAALFWVAFMLSFVFTKHIATLPPIG